MNHFNLPAASKFKFLIFYAQNAKETNELLKGEKTNKTEAKKQQPSSLTFAYRTLSLIVSYLCQPLSIHKLHKAQTTSILAPVLNMNAFSGGFFVAEFPIYIASRNLWSNRFKRVMCCVASGP